MPFSTNTVNDNTHNEEDNQIKVLTGHRPSHVGWNDSRTLPEDWTHSNQSEDHNNSDDAEGWKEDEHMPAGWNDRMHQQQNLPSGWISRDKSNYIKVKRDNRCLLASKLPTVFVTNHRSFFPKFRNFLDAMLTLGLTLGLHSEIWEQKENKIHQNKIEEALEMEGVQYISNPRPNRSGGGAAITLISGELTLTKLDVSVPKNLEVV